MTLITNQSATSHGRREREREQASHPVMKLPLYSVDKSARNNTKKMRYAVGSRKENQLTDTKVTNSSRSSIFQNEKGNLPTGVVIICVFVFGVAFTIWCYFVVKGALARCYAWQHGGK